MHPVRHQYLYQQARWMSPLGPIALCPAGTTWWGPEVSSTASASTRNRGYWRHTGARLNILIYTLYSHGMWVEIRESAHIHSRVAYLQQPHTTHSAIHLQSVREVCSGSGDCVLEYAHRPSDGIELAQGEHHLGHSREGTIEGDVGYSRRGTHGSACQQGQAARL